MSKKLYRSLFLSLDQSIDLKTKRITQCYIFQKQFSRITYKYPYTVIQSDFVHCDLVPVIPSIMDAKRSVTEITYDGIKEMTTRIAIALRCDDYKRIDVKIFANKKQQGKWTLYPVRKPVKTTLLKPSACLNHFK